MAVGATDAGGGRWGDHNAERRRQILEAAIAVIGESPPGADIPVQLIADRAGVKRSVIYRHFADRQDLDHRIREFAVQQATAQLVPALSLEGSLEDAIFHVVDTYVRMVAANPRMHEWIERGPGSEAPSGQALVAGTKAAIATQLGEMVTLVAAMLGQSDPAIDSGAFGVVSMVDGMVTRWLDTSPSGLDAARLADLLTSSIWYLIDGHARARGVVLDPKAQIADLLGAASNRG
ncbi:TetR/AcrR family transcriptional regulator [Rhodococcus daqingensis]|uniref:TetR/AcrR family transcriptional regulator n=1 Tax=Rhodococcus daqingensis TaxID=2479363 RepID=A0ABW2S3R3_9NOCA